VSLWYEEMFYVSEGATASIFTVVDVKISQISGTSKASFNQKGVKRLHVTNINSKLFY
jgi:hypothetical protein